MTEFKRRKIPAEVARTRARLAGLVSRQASPEAVDAARAELRAAVSSARTTARALELAALPAPDRMRLAALILAGGGDSATA